jgi:hypothetical protein
MVPGTTVAGTIGFMEKMIFASLRLGVRIEL